MSSSKHPEYIIFSEQNTKWQNNKTLTAFFCLFFISISVSVYALVKVQLLNEDIKTLKSSLLKIKNIGDVNAARNRQFDIYEDIPSYDENPKKVLGNISPPNQLNYLGDYLEVVDSKPEENFIDDTISSLKDLLTRKNKSHEDHRIVKKSTEAEEESATDFQIVEVEKPTHKFRHRNQIEILESPPCRSSRLKSLAAIHFNGDTSHYIYKTHQHYAGNAKLRHPNKRYVDWKTSNWVESIGMRDHFKHRNGILTVKQSGLYLIYVQIYFSDEHDENSYRVYKNMDEVILQCTVTAPSSEKLTKGNTCFTAGVAYLDADDNISITDISTERYSLFEQGKSFYGLIKLGDIEIK